MINPDELERLARAATPGPWVWEDEDLLNPEMRERRQRVIKSEPYEGQWIDTESADAAFIAAANPATILALLSANREMREREHRLDRALTLALDYLGELEPGDSRAVSDEYVAMLAVLCRVEPNEPGGEMAIINAAISAREARSALLTTQVREG